MATTAKHDLRTRRAAVHPETGGHAPRVAIDSLLTGGRLFWGKPRGLTCSSPIPPPPTRPTVTAGPSAPAGAHRLRECLFQDPAVLIGDGIECGRWHLPGPWCGAECSDQCGTVGGFWSGSRRGSQLWNWATSETALTCSGLAIGRSVGLGAKPLTFRSSSVSKTAVTGARIPDADPDANQAARIGGRGPPAPRGSARSRQMGADNPPPSILVVAHLARPSGAKAAIGDRPCQTARAARVSRNCAIRLARSKKPSSAGSRSAARSIAGRLA